MFLFFALCIFCAESAVRYTVWWSRSRRDGETREISYCLLGTALTSAVMLAFGAYAILHEFGYGMPPGYRAVLDVGFVAAMLFKLFPCWWFAGYTRLQIVTGLTWRTAIITALAAVTLWLR